MSTAQLLALDLAASILAAGSWGAAAIVAARPAMARRSAALTLALMTAAWLGLIAQVVLVLVLWVSGWWFVQEKLLLALPLGVAGSAAAVLVAARPMARVLRGAGVGRKPGINTALIAAALCAFAGLALRFVVGYPLSPVPAATVLVLVGLGTRLAHAVFSGQGRRLVIGLAALVGLCLVASVGFNWLTSIAGPVALAGAHSHGESDESDDSTPTASVTELRTAEDAPGPIKHFDLTAAKQQVALPSGTATSAWTFGSLPGPELRVQLGDLVEVTLHNADIPDGVTIHWHGYDVPNGEDGVAGVTQDAVLPGDSFTYRFVADETGTYWYHTHQNASDGVRRGLYGTLVVEPRGGFPEDVDLVVPVHTVGRTLLLGDSDIAAAAEVGAGDIVRLRLINTDQVPQRLRLAGTSFTVDAIDGRTIVGATPLEGAALRLPAGGRMDLVFTMPSTGALLTSDASSRPSLMIAPPGAEATLTPDTTTGDFDPLSYGTPSPTAQLPSDTGVVHATMVLDRLPRFLSGRPIQGYTVDGEVFPHIPSIEVEEGDVLELTIANRGWETHPMHIHGHHVLVLSRNGVPATGAPLWLDTFDVQPGEVWVVALVADNPGIWMDHCHNLDHAAEGMMMALSYVGVTTPFDQGGDHGNRAE